MTMVVAHTSGTTTAPIPASRLTVSTNTARLLLILLTGAAIAGGLLATGGAAEAQAVAAAGADLTRLLRAMAALKALTGLGLIAAVLWRFGVTVSPVWFAAYACASGAMAAGPALIWSMAHVGAGTLLLHGGLLAAVLLLWRDPAVGDRLSAMLTARRAALSARVR